MARILLLCWRDSAHPQGGGSERYLEHVAAHAAARGHEVVLRTSRPDGSPRREWRDGYLVSRGGGRYTVYPRALAAILASRLGLGPLRTGTGRPGESGPGHPGGRRGPEVVVDTQNGVPFFSRLVAGAPVVLLVHHVHREQWPVAGPVVGRLGWWIESWLSPRVHRGCRYVTVSDPSAAELASLGVDPDRITVVRNGLDPLPDGIAAGPAGPRPGPPRVVVLSRLVPHKHVEHALDAVRALRVRHPGLVLDVVGDGWWATRLHEHAARIGLTVARGPGAGDDDAPAVDPDVVFHGHLDEADKHRVLAAASVHVLPSRKEGWGLAVSEAAQHGVPTVGYRHSGGLRDSVLDGETGLLVGTPEELTAACGRLLDDPALRGRLGEAARERAAGMSWEVTGRELLAVLDEVRGGRGANRGQA